MATAETTLLALVSTEREILPKRLKSVHYNLIIQPHLQEATEFDGTMVIELDVAEETSSIPPNAIELEILRTEVTAGDGKPIDILA